MQEANFTLQPPPQHHRHHHPPLSFLGKKKVHIIFFFKAGGIKIVISSNLENFLIFWGFFAKSLIMSKFLLQTRDGGFTGRGADARPGPSTSLRLVLPRLPASTLS